MHVGRNKVAQAFAETVQMDNGLLNALSTVYVLPLALWERVLTSAPSQRERELLMRRTQSTYKANRQPGLRPDRCFLGDSK